MKKLFLLLSIIFISNASANTQPFEINKKISQHIKQLLIEDLAANKTIANEDLEVNFIKDLPNISDKEIVGSKLLNHDKLKQYFTISIVLKNKYNRYSDQNINGNYQIFTTLPTLKNIFKKGDIITENDIGLLKLSKFNIHKDTVLNKNDLIGKTPKSIIYADKIINFNDLISPKVINKGDMISVMYEDKRVNIKMSAQALESGAINEIIKVKNPRSNNVLHGKVIKENLVILAN